MYFETNQNDNSLRCSLETGKRLKVLREQNGFTIDALVAVFAKTYGIKISRDSIIGYEVSDPNHLKAGKNNGMRVEYLRCFADLYGVSADYLLGLTEYRSSDISIGDICRKTGLNEESVIYLTELQKAEKHTYGGYFGGTGLINFLLDIFRRDGASMILHYNRAINALVSPTESSQPQLNEDEIAFLTDMENRGFEILCGHDAYSWHLQKVINSLHGALSPHILRMLKKRTEVIQIGKH